MKTQDIGAERPTQVSALLSVFVMGALALIAWTRIPDRVAGMAR
jgi:hypothetical protein